MDKVASLSYETTTNERSPVPRATLAHTEESDRHREESTEESKKRILAVLSWTAKSYPEIVTELTPEVSTDAGLLADTTGLWYDMAPDNEPTCCQDRSEATETSAVMLEEGPAKPRFLHVIIESEFQNALSEEVCPILVAAEMLKYPKASPCT